MDSEKVWCANKVSKRTGNVINGQWSDCEPGCPGTAANNDVPQSPQQSNKDEPIIFSSMYVN